MIGELTDADKACLFDYLVYQAVIMFWEDRSDGEFAGIKVGTPTMEVAELLPEEFWHMRGLL